MRRIALAGAALVGSTAVAVVFAGGVGTAASVTGRHRETSGTARAHAAAAGGTYLRVDGAPGESIQSGYANQIDLSLWNWQITNDGRAEMGGLMVKFGSNRAVAPLQTDAQVGKRLKQVVLTQVNGSGAKSHVIILTNAAVDSVSESDNVSEVPMDEVKFSYQQLEEIYYYYSPSGGTAHIYKSCYNVASQTTCAG